MKIFHSLRWRIQLWHGAFLFAVLVGLGIAAYRYERETGMQRIDDELRKRIIILTDFLPPPPRGQPRPGEGGRPFPPPTDREDFGDRPPPPDQGDFPRRRDGPGFSWPGFRLPREHATLFDPGSSDNFYYVVWGRDGSLVGSSANLAYTGGPPPRPHRGQPGSANRDRGQYREAYLFTPPGECLLVGCSTEPEKRALQRYGQMLAAIEVAIFLLGLGGGWWATAHSLRPLKAITKAANDIADGQLNQRISVNRGDSELGELAVLLNETFAKLESSFARQAQFTSDAAHEIRTPLSVVISQAQLALRGEREPAEYREMFGASLRAARRMQKLTQSLLELSRLDNVSIGFALVPSDLRLLVIEAIETLDLAASERGIVFVQDLSPTACLADPDSMIRVMLNLLGNAIEHCPEQTSIGITTYSSDGKACITVTDQGPGIAAEHLPHIFDRFYRVDQSRNRKTGGTGLGLAICKSIVEAHGGTIEATSEIGKGSIFTVTLPEK